MKKLMVIAHPDDEVLWGAGMVIRYPNDWTILCCSIPRADPIRAVKFLDSCKILGAMPMMINKPEAPANEHLTGLEDIDISDFDYILTHNAYGEYGHLQHKSVNRWITRTYGKKKLGFFGYRKGGTGAHKIELNDIEAAKKLKALKAYDHIHPYNGVSMPKWEALYDRYITIEGISFNVETYEGEMPRLSDI